MAESAHTKIASVEEFLRTLLDHVVLRDADHKDLLVDVLAGKPDRPDVVATAREVEEAGNGSPEPEATGGTVDTAGSAGSA
jgi:hypothetical protein